MAKWMVRYPDGATVEIEADDVKVSSGVNLYKGGALVARFPIEASVILGAVPVKAKAAANV